MDDAIQKIYAHEDSYVSSDKPLKNENEFPLLNIGRAENGSLNRGYLKFELGDPSNIKSAELCLYQIYTGNKALDTDKLFVHTLQEDWSQGDITWNSAPSWKGDPINVLSDGSTLSTAKGTICFGIKNPKKIPSNGYGFIIRGEEVCDTGVDCDKKDRWFRSSEYQEKDYQPYMQVELLDPTLRTPNPVSNKDSSSTGIIVGATLGCVVLALAAALAFMVIRRRNEFEEEESSVESEEEKDAFDKIGGLFGVVTSEDSEEDTFYTRDTVTRNNDEYTTAEGVEVRNYTIGEKVQNMLFGVPEETTTVTEDYTYDNRGRYRYR